MYGHIFNHLKRGTIVTVWVEGPHWGALGRVVRTEGKAQKGGQIIITLNSGEEISAGYRSVAVGDNSEFKEA